MQALPVGLNKGRIFETDVNEATPGRIDCRANIDAGACTAVNAAIVLNATPSQVGGTRILDCAVPGMIREARV